MIEEVGVPRWVVVLARMTRRQARLGARRGYVTGRRAPRRHWRLYREELAETPAAVTPLELPAPTPAPTVEVEATGEPVGVSWAAPVGDVTDGESAAEVPAGLDLPAGLEELADSESAAGVPELPPLSASSALPAVLELLDDEPAIAELAATEPVAEGEGEVEEEPLDITPLMARANEAGSIVVPEPADLAEAQPSPLPLDAPVLSELTTSADLEVLRDEAGGRETTSEGSGVVTPAEAAVESPPLRVRAAPPPAVRAAPRTARLAPRPATPASTPPGLAPAVLGEYNRLGLDYRRPMPRPKVRGLVIDSHCHLLAARHAGAWFEAADHYGIDCFATMTPLEEAAALQREWGHRLRFVAVPRWGPGTPTNPKQWAADFQVRLEAFYNLGSRVVKFHASPGTMAMRGIRLDDPLYQPLLKEAVARGMAIMTHIGDPDLWYAGKYGSSPEAVSNFGTRQEHYRMWEQLLEEYRGVPWLGAHLGGNPEDPYRLQTLLDRFPDLWLDCSATRWMAREVSARREAVRELFLRFQDRILFGSDQVSGDDRGFDFLASRFWVHRKLWETAYAGPSPILDPDLPEDRQPMMRGLALPDRVLQKIYHDNPMRFLEKVGMGFLT